MTLLDKALETYNMTLPKFSRHTGIAKSTLQTWKENGKTPKIGELLLIALIENYELKQKDEAVQKVIELYSFK